MNRSQREVVPIVLGDHVSHVGVKEPGGRDVAENVLAVELRYQRAAVDKAAANGVAIFMAVRSDRVDGRDRGVDASHGQ